MSAGCAGWPDRGPPADAQAPRCYTRIRRECCRMPPPDKHAHAERHSPWEYKHRIMTRPNQSAEIKACVDGRRRGRAPEE